MGELVPTLSTMTTRDVIGLVLGLLLVVGVIAIAIGNNTSDNLQSTVESLEERVGELEEQLDGNRQRGGDGDLGGIIDELPLDELRHLQERLDEDFPLRQEQMDQLRDLFVGELPLDEDLLRDLFEDGAPPFDEDRLGRLFGRFGGRGEGFPEGFENFEFNFDLDPSFVDDLVGEGLLDDEQAQELRDALDMLREALAGISGE